MLGKKLIFPAVTVILLLTVACGSSISNPAAGSETPTPTGTVESTIDSTTATPTPSPTPSPTPTLTPNAGSEDRVPTMEDATKEPGRSATPTNTEPSSVVEPDPDFLTALSSARFSTRGWKTDFSLHSVPYDEIIGGGPPRDGIAPIDEPRFGDVSLGNEWLNDEEPVIFFEHNGDARAYPLRIMTQHEIVNDVVGGIPVTVTFCPLCNSAIVFDRRLDGEVLDFGTSGNLRNSDLIMWDRQTESWWQQFTGEAIVGSLTGKKLQFLTATIISWEDFKVSRPEGTALDRNTGFNRSYTRSPYAGYDRVDNPPFLFDGDLDGRLLPKERVVAVELDSGEAVAFPYGILREERVVDYSRGDHEMVIFFNPNTLSSFVDRTTLDFEEVGSSGVFNPHVDDQRLTFRPDGDKFLDNETGSEWNILGEAIQGPLTGKKLTPILHGDHFWFAFGAFRPDTIIYQGSGQGS